MTEREKLTKLKALIGNTTLDDDALSVYLEIAGDEVLRKCYPFAADTQMYEVPERYETIQIRLARNEVLRRGADGQTSMTDNGVTRVYESDNTLLNRIVPFAHVPGVVADEIT